MTPTELKQARHTLGLTQAAIAPLLGRKLRNLQQWEAGEREIDGAAVLLIKAYLSGYRPDYWPEAPTA